VDEIFQAVAEAVREHSSVAAAMAEAGNLPAMMSQSFEALEFDRRNYMEFCIAIATRTGLDLTAAQVKSLGSPQAVVNHLTEARQPRSATSIPKPGSLRAWLLPALEACRSPTDYYRVVMEIEQSATPGDIEFLVEMGGPWSQEFNAGLRTLYDSMRRVRRSIAPHGLTLINPSVLLFAGDEAKERHLVVGFAGVRGGLFLQTPLLLQYLGPNNDFLLLRDPAVVGFATGIRGYAEPFRAVIERLKRDVNFGKYQTLSCLGISSGGCAALAAGVLLEADRSVSFSGGLPSHALRADTRMVPPDLENILRAVPGDKSLFYSVFGADNLRDAANSRAIAKFFAITEMPISGIRNHNVVWDLHAKGALAALLRDLGLNT
jgi:dienelactone hydrolase